MVPSMWKSTGRALTGTGAWELAKSFPDLETRGTVPSRGGCPQAPAPRNWPWTLSVPQGSQAGWGASGRVSGEQVVRGRGSDVRCDTKTRRGGASC